MSSEFYQNLDAILVIVEKKRKKNAEGMIEQIFNALIP